MESDDGVNGKLPRLATPTQPRLSTPLNEINGPSLPRPSFLKIQYKLTPDLALPANVQDAVTNAHSVLRSKVLQETESLLERYDVHLLEFIESIASAYPPDAAESDDRHPPEKHGSDNRHNSTSSSGTGAAPLAKRSGSLESMEKVSVRPSLISTSSKQSKPPVTFTSSQLSGTTKSAHFSSYSPCETITFHQQPDTTQSAQVTGTRGLCSEKSQLQRADTWTMGATKSTVRLKDRHLDKMRRMETEHERQMFGSFLSHLYFLWKELDEPKRTGKMASFVKSKYFEVLCMIVILANGVFICHLTNDTMRDVEEDRSQLELQVEIPFLIFYILELFIKFVVHRGYLLINRDAFWNLMDIVLVLTGLLGALSTHVFRSDGIGDATFMRILRFFKVTRLLRLLRALKFVSELRLILVCILGSFMALFWVLVLMAFLLIMFSVFFVQGFGFYLQANWPGGVDNAKEIMELFGDVQTGWLTLWKCITNGLEWGVPYTLITQLGAVYECGFIFFVGFFLIAVWNVVTSIFLEKALQLARPDVETLMLEKNRTNLADAEELMGICQVLQGDEDDSGRACISMDDLLHMWDDPKFKLFFDVRSIDIKDVGMFYKLLARSANSDKVDLESFIEGCMTLKGVASSIDLHTLRFEVQKLHEVLRELMMFVQEAFPELATAENGYMNMGKSSSKQFEKPKGRYTLAGARM